MAFGQNLKYLRKKNNFTADMLADELGVTLKTISEWEAGQAVPEEEILAALCAMFDVPRDVLVFSDLTGEEKKESAAAKGKGAAVADGVFLSLAVVLYLVLGLVWNAWHPGWIVFLFALSFGSFAHALSGGAKLQEPESFGALSGGIFLFAVAVYLVLGFVGNGWHPGWVIFPAVVALIGLVGWLLRRK